MERDPFVSYKSYWVYTETSPSRAAVANKVRVDLTTASKWIVATLGGEGENATMRQLAQMFRALESYFHPANSGRYVQGKMWGLCCLLLFL